MRGQGASERLVNHGTRRPAAWSVADTSSPSDGVGLTRSWMETCRTPPTPRGRDARRATTPLSPIRPTTECEAYLENDAEGAITDDLLVSQSRLGIGVNPRHFHPPCWSAAPVFPLANRQLLLSPQLKQRRSLPAAICWGNPLSRRLRFLGQLESSNLI